MNSSMRFGRAFDDDFEPSGGSGHLPRNEQYMTQRKLLLRGSVAAIVGAILGITMSMVVNVALIEVSISPFFALYFGVLFLGAGGLIIWRIISGQSPDPDENHKKQLLVLASLVLLSGVLCFVLRAGWFLRLSWITKIPVYTLLGTSAAFSLAFTAVDVVNLLSGILQASAAKPLVQSIGQVRLVILMSLLMGGCFGLIFGLMDVEDSNSYHIRLSLMREEHYCYPIGAALGAVAGFGNEYLRQKDRGRWQSVRQTEFDDDI